MIICPGRTGCPIRAPRCSSDSVATRPGRLVVSSALDRSGGSAALQNRESRAFLRFWVFSSAPPTPPESCKASDGVLVLVVEWLVVQSEAANPRVSPGPSSRPTKLANHRGRMRTPDLRTPPGGWRCLCRSAAYPQKLKLGLARGSRGSCTSRSFLGYAAPTRGTQVVRTPRTKWRRRHGRLLPRRRRSPRRAPGWRLRPTTTRPQACRRVVPEERAGCSWRPR